VLNSYEVVGKRPKNFPLLPSGELHIWQVTSHPAAAQLEQFKRALSETELSKIPFFEIESVRESYVIGQGALRILLSSYLEIPPNLVEIGRRRKGKPYSIDDPGLYFNMSNSGGLAAIAFSRDSEVGIDIERIRPLPDLDDMITMNFTASEIRFINTRPKEKINRFFRFWTVKESYLKAIGEGMRLTPDSLEFSIEKDCIKQLSVKGIFEPEDWNFKEFSPATDYVGTITYGRDEAVIRQMKFK
jgi:4'-phosphopantetheinyl transferase